MLSLQCSKKCCGYCTVVAILISHTRHSTSSVHCLVQRLRENWHDIYVYGVGTAMEMGLPGSILLLWIWLRHCHCPCYWQLERRNPILRISEYSSCEHIVQGVHK
ncbi:hypothetical protein DL89DRAFT_89137 [Linderina pennispora]|uniref:Uncharacterized protein n=1 Tax=Linderina pennispora TaxID=61395 RepID=A0A1Y1WJ89_9FUNG|nr:uncharacterized protein DL89DRAFT_89137 [Linderina pennispora]ORX73164.1 hypothetical protein DL89DRAFT_89137 [Linderina pennispora]